MKFLRCRGFEGNRVPGRLLSFPGPLALLVACGSHIPASHQVRAPLEDLRSLAAFRGKGTDSELLGRWAMAEMFEPGGTAYKAKEAREFLGQSPRPGLFTNLARAIYDDEHGEPMAASEFYVATLKAATTSNDFLAPLVGWFATRNLLELRNSVPNMFGRHRGDLEAILQKPGHLGWRAVAELEEFRASEVQERAETTGSVFDKEVVSRMGCASGVRLAGPFGQGTTADRRRAFAAEKPGPWPAAWPSKLARGVTPRVLPTEQKRCVASAKQHLGEGIYYAEAYFDSPTARDLLLAVQGAVKVWVDDTPVLERDLRSWGVWQRFGTAIQVPAGRHRILARVLSDSSGFRMLNLDGTSAQIPTDGDASRPYSLVPPKILVDPNPLQRLVDAKGAPTFLEAALGASLAHAEGLDDVASVLLGPLVAPKDAAPLALSLAAMVARGDGALPEEVRHRNEKAYRTKAAASDPGLWFSRGWLILNDAEQRGLVEAVEPLRQMVVDFPKSPDVAQQLAGHYSKLGWRAERMKTLQELTLRFPEALGPLRMYLDALEEDGAAAEADKVANRIMQLDADAEVSLERALARQDWKAAIAELRRFETRRPERTDIPGRLAEVLERSGDPAASAEFLAKALTKNPEDAQARFRKADLAYAAGDKGALRRALVDALQAGAKTAELREAIDLVEGATNLEAYRRDGRTTVKQFEAWEHGGHHMEGTAARVLDYAAVWVRPDGTSEMLEHEILKIQSQEAVQKEAEQQPPTGLVLKLRVIKGNGSVLEPEFVTGKPTLTMPHLEVGDYIEIEHVTAFGNDGQRGKTYRSPHWFFREADKGYWRSEFVVITPKSRTLQIETRGTVPAPKLRKYGAFEERHWRVDLSPPAVEEPDAPRITEFLPSVRVGWGVRLDDVLERLVDNTADETPLDPRLHDKALEIVKGVPDKQSDERARRVYRWVADNISDGRERDGRRVIFGKSGSREAAFEHLVRQLGIPLERAVVQSRLAPPALGPMSELEQWDSVALRLRTDKGLRWLTVRDKFAPFGYVQAELRSQPAIVLTPGLPKETTTSLGSLDGVSFSGRADVREDGSAAVELVQKFSGKVAISMRNVFDRVPEGQLRDFVESRILSRNIPGARLREWALEHKTDLDEPLTLRIKADVPELVKNQGERSVLKSLFPMRLAQLATLPERQTPLLISGSSHLEVDFQLVFAEPYRLPASLPTGEIRDGERLVTVNDAVAGHALTLRRIVDIPAGRVAPGADYGAFQKFSQEADALVEKDIVLGL